MRLDTASRSSRREFLAAAGVVPLCCASRIAPAGSWSIEGNRLKIDLRRAPELRRVGEPRTVVEAARKLNIMVVQDVKGHWAAVDRTCTHGGAMCAYQKRSRTIQCTSLNHAEYTLAGKLLHGRTHGDLRSYAVAANRDYLEVALGANA